MKELVYGRVRKKEDSHTMSANSSRDGGRDHTPPRERFIEELVPTYLWQSVVTFVLGFISPFFIGIPFAIVAIVFASRVDSLRVQGRILKAMKSSNLAKKWMWVSLSLTIGPFVYVSLLNLAEHL